MSYLIDRLARPTCSPSQFPYIEGIIPTLARQHCLIRSAESLNKEGTQTLPWDDSRTLSGVYGSPIVAQSHQKLSRRVGGCSKMALSQDNRGTVDRQAEPSFDLQQYLAEKGGEVNEALDLAVPLRGYPDKIHEAMRYSLLGGGKRLCSAVAIATCEMFGGSQEAVMPTACALEMLHDFSLVHDDLPCMDNSALRRGKLTNHLVYGEATAVLTGDALICRAFEHIAVATKGVPADRVLRVVGQIARNVGAEGMVAGQIVDLESTGKASVSLETLEYIHLHKTASLVESSTVSGAILGGASDDDIETMAVYGRALGLLFQVVDDILDVTKSTEQLGKPAGSDSLADKVTYPKLMGIEKTKLLAEELCERCKEHLFKFDPIKAAPLLAIADYVVSRPR